MLSLASSTCWRGDNDDVTAVRSSYSAVLFGNLFAEFICTYLDAKDVVQLSLTSRQLSRAVQQPHVWRRLLQCHFRFTDLDLKALDTMSSGAGVAQHHPSSANYCPYLRADRAASLVLRPGCTIDPLMLAPGTPGLARVLRGSPPRKTIPSPDWPHTSKVHCAALTSSQGVTPTPSRLRPWSTLPRGIEWSPSTTPDSNDFFLRATVQDLTFHQRHRGGTATATPANHHHPFTDAEDTWSVHWTNAGSSESQPWQHQHQEYLFHTEDALPPHRAAADNILEPLVHSSSSSSDILDAHYTSGALILGDEHHSRFAEIWEAREVTSTPTGDTTVVHITKEPLEFSGPPENDTRSGSLLSCWFGDDRLTPTMPSVPSVVTPQPNNGSSADAVVLASLVCAKTLVAALRCGADAYPFQKLYAYLHKHRIENFLAMISSRRLHVFRAITYEQHAEALAMLTENIENIMEGGCGSAANAIREALVKDLVLRGRLLRTLQRDDDALGDFSLAHMLDGSCQEAYVESSIITTSSDRCAANATRILSPMFQLDEAYDEAVASGKSITERAAFLFEVLFWRGPSLMLYVYQYLLCDAVRTRPVRLLLAAEELAQNPAEKLMTRSWILFDTGNAEKALSTAELAVSLLSHDVTRSIAETEQRCVEISKRLLATHNIETLLARQFGNDDPCIRRLTAIRSAMQLLQDSDLAATLAAVYAEDMKLFALAISKCGDTTDVAGASPLIFAVPASASFAYFTLAYLSGESDVSVDAYRRHMFARPLPSRTGTAMNNLGFLVLKRHGPAMALPLFEAAQEFYPTHFTTLQNIARCYVQLGRVTDANRALSVVAGCPCFRGPRAEVLFERSRLAVSPMPDLHRATELNPRCSNPYRLRAALAMDRGDPEEAFREINKIIHLTMEAPDVALRALFRRDTGDRIGATRDMALAATLMPSNKEYRNTLRELIVEDAQHNWLRYSTSEDADDGGHHSGGGLQRAFTELVDDARGEEVEVSHAGADPNREPNADGARAPQDRASIVDRNPHHTSSPHDAAEEAFSNASTPTLTLDVRHEQLQHSVIEEEIDRAIVSVMQWFHVPA